MESVFKKPISRRSFIKILLSGAALLTSGGLFARSALSKEPESKGRKKRSVKGAHDIVLAEGKDPYAMTVKAVEAMGGMGRFVKKGSTVVVKPNMSWDRAPEYASNTNPLVVAAVVEMCVLSGAKRVNVFDRTCNAEGRCYVSSGVKKAALDKGAKVYFVDDWNSVKARFAYKSLMEGWPIFRDAVECDTFINVPVLKDHGLTSLTLSMKNLMGVCNGDRGGIHQDIGKRLVDLTDFISPDLTIIDAYRVLMANGPSGGDLKDVVTMKKLIVATDPTLADTYACKMVKREPMDIPYIKEAAGRNFGTTNVAGADIFKVSV